ncbi:hypothetical protein [Ruegeria atlantica]|uniref:hypothetical protein n=1 Tax=Ruegeria atlantica TaxID=81569 RepID=UPI00147F9F29|nr:hypothetical protein [Ruegeria atlantica]
MFVQYLLDSIKKYADAKSLSVASVGRYSIGDVNLVDRLKTGRITIRRVNRVIQWLSNHWPSDLDWPPDIPRPDPTPDSPAALAAADASKAEDAA